MTRPAAACSGAASQAGPVDNWISRATAGTVAALAGLAGAISYSHMRQLAQDHGQAGWHAHAFPLSVDGLEIVASLVLLAEHRSGRRPGWLPWAALVTGAVGSLAANVATADPGTISRIIAGWPALALVLAVKLLFGMLNRHAGSQPRPGDGHNQMFQPAVPHSARRTPATLALAATSLDSRELGDLPTPKRAQPGDLAPRIAELLPAARAARDEISRKGYRLTRDALAVHLRHSGHPVRNSHLTPLLQVLRNDVAVGTLLTKPHGIE